MTCLVFEGADRCVWCREPADRHPYRWCRRCRGDMSTPDPTDREAQLAGRPAWQWRQHPCACRHGIVTIQGTPLTDNDLTALRKARTVEQPAPRRYLPFDEPQHRPARTMAET